VGVEFIGEQPVAVGDVYDVVGMFICGADRVGHEFGLCVDVVGGVVDYCGMFCGVG